MRRALGFLVVAVALGTVACVPEQKYKAALAQTEKAVKDGDGQKQRADACEQRLSETTTRAAAAEKRAGDLSERLSELEKAASAAASADAAKQRALAAELAKTRELLEGEKVAASAEAERQRQLATKLEQEKTAADVEADRQRVIASKLEQEKTAAGLEAERQRKLAAQLEQEKSALEKRSAEYQTLASSLDAEIKAGRIQVSELQGKVTVRMAERVLFPSGSATVSRDGRKTLEKVAEAFQGVKRRMIRVEGHTDNVPIKTDRFPSNWELSSARAIAVVRILQDKGLDPNLLGAAGYSEYQPIAANGTAEGRAQNRRIEISLAAPLSALPTAPAGKE